LTRQPTVPAHAGSAAPGPGGHDSTHIVHVGLIDSTPIDHSDVEPGDAWDDTQYDPFDSPVTTVDFAAGQACVPSQTGQDDAPTAGPRVPHSGGARGRAGWAADFTLHTSPNCDVHFPAFLPVPTWLKVFPPLGSLVAATSDLMDEVKSLAIVHGFFVIKRNTNKFADQSPKYIKFLCSKHGKDKKVNEVGKEGCNWHLHMTRNQAKDQWMVTQAQYEHNGHDLLTPEDMAVLHKWMPLEVKEMIRTLHEHNYAPRHMTDMIQTFMPEIPVTWSKTTLDNFLRDLRKPVSNIPQVTQVKQALEAHQGLDPGTVFSILKDQDMLVRAIFWATGRQRELFCELRDVVVFDPTYQTNSLGMALALFVGVTQHGHNVLLASALMTSETTESFTWVFQKLKDMCGVPEVLLTDQDHAIAAAVSRVLPDTVHRLCTWHLSQNFIRNLLVRDADVKGAWKVYGELLRNIHLGEEEFKAKWDQMVDLLGPNAAAKKRYLEALYENRAKWARSCMKPVFDAGMTTTQRGESFNAAVKRQISKHTDLPQLVLTLVRDVAAREDKRKREVEVRARHYHVKCTVPWQGMLKLASTLTPYAYGLVKEQHDLATKFWTMSEDGGQVVRKEGGGEEGRAYDIRPDGSCACEWGIQNGLPCRHVLAWAQAKELPEVPEGTVKSRWLLKDGREAVLVLPSIASATEVVDLEVDINALGLHEHAKLLAMPKERLANYKAILDAFHRGELDGWEPPAATAASALSKGDTESSTGPPECMELDPVIVKHKGRPRRRSAKAPAPKRLKSWLESTSKGKKSKKSLGC
jgi:hypothetical protein